MTTPRAKPHPRAFTLVEAALSCVIIGMALVPAMAMLGATASDARSQSDLTTGVALARQLLSEVVQCQYEDPDGSDTGESRSTWEDLDDYNGFSESTVSSKSGAALSGYTGWRRTVAVDLVNLTSPNTVAATDVGLKRITVTATSPAGKTYSVSALRCSTSAYERPPSAAGTYTSGVNILLQPTGGNPIVTGVTLPNEVP